MTNVSNVLSIQGIMKMNIRNTASIFGTNVSVNSWIWVTA